MGTNKHAEQRVKHGHTTPSSGPDRLTDKDYALRAGKAGTTARKSTLPREPSTRDAGRDDRRSGSESHRGRHDR